MLDQREVTELVSRRTVSNRSRRRSEWQGLGIRHVRLFPSKT